MRGGGLGLQQRALGFGLGQLPLQRGAALAGHGLAAVGGLGLLAQLVARGLVLAGGALRLGQPPLRLVDAALVGQ